MADADANQAQMADALANHDRVKHSTQLPLFFGRKDKDTCNARLLMDRFETASRIARWNDDEVRKVEQFYMILRDRALTWWKGLGEVPGLRKNADGHFNNWAQIKEEFLGAYATKYTAKSTCTNFGDLTQRSGENVQDFYLRVLEAYLRIKEQRPEELNVVEFVGVPPVAAASALAIKTEGMDDMGRFVLHQLFLAGLREDLRIKTMEAGHAFVKDSLKTAKELEAIMTDRNRKTFVSALQADDDDDDFENFCSNYLANKDEDELEPWEEQFLDKVNAIRVNKGKTPFKFGHKKRFNRSTVTCRFCGIKGHFQKECKRRIREGKPMVDMHGKPFKANVVKEDDEEEDEELAENVSALAYYGINSIRKTSSLN